MTEPTNVPVPDPALVQRAAQALHAQLPGCTHDEHGADCAALADVVAAELAPELAELADYRNRITWETTCGEHARLLDACRTADERADKAEAALADMTRKRDEQQWRTGDAQRQTRCQRDRAQQAEARIAQGLAVAEVIDANGFGWAADSIRRALTPTADTPKEPTT